MVIDTSALIAILLGEPEAEPFASAIAGDPKRLISAFTSLEAGIVMEAKKGESGGRELDLLLHTAKIEVVPLTGELTELARSAWREYGKGRPLRGLEYWRLLFLRSCQMCRRAPALQGQRFLPDGHHDGTLELLTGRVPSRYDLHTGFSQSEPNRINECPATPDCPGAPQAPQPEEKTLTTCSPATRCASTQSPS